MKTSGGFICVLVSIVALSARMVSAESVSEKLLFKLIDCNMNAASMPLTDFPVGSYFFHDDEVRKSGFDPAQLKRGYYRGIYDGIDLICYGDYSHVEYVFIVSPGADEARIRMLSEGQKTMEVSQSGKINYKLKTATVEQTKPVVYLKVENSKRQVEGSYEIDGNNFISVIPGDGFKKQVSNREFLDFLNCAQTNAVNPLGSNMHFDKDGNVWLNKKMKDGEKMFDVDSSRIAYDAGEIPGRRYYFKDASGGGRKSYADKPIAGVSWLGAMKYCNWYTLTKVKGATTDDRCYTEGPNIRDWTPAPSKPWPKYMFEVIATEDGKGAQVQTEYRPTETIIIHFLISFYYEEEPETQEHEAEPSEEGPTYPDEQAPPEESPVTSEFSGGGKTDLRSTDGVSYKEPPGQEQRPWPVPEEWDDRHQHQRGRGHEEHGRGYGWGHIGEVPHSP